ncbi:Frataxin [Daldinia decipiens]|uniref:Frataxin n=1 Tax=Daldinia decipiens TaxID=326647 RepID=UPI0020C3D6EF|nr:Frataxin [Daldinia decipiens]KAI1659333.1 Frataxin [Daldinia decipiens]
MMRANLLRLAQSGRGNLSIAARRASVLNVNQRLTAMLLPRAVSHQPVLTRLFSTSSPVANQTAPKVDIAPITQAEYHDLADQYLDAVLTKYEELQDEYGEVDVEYSSGVMTVKIPNVGIYIINKQPPNKQIWLSSPVSGPKRYDYVRSSEGQGENQDTSEGEWVYARDGTTLSDLLLKETGIVVELGSE